jgi:hypothetical protein
VLLIRLAPYPFFPFDLTMCFVWPRSPRTTFHFHPRRVTPPRSPGSRPWHGSYRSRRCSPWPRPTQPYNGDEILCWSKLRNGYYSGKVNSNHIYAGACLHHSGYKIRQIEAVPAEDWTQVIPPVEQSPTHTLNSGLASLHALSNCSLGIVRS